MTISPREMTSTFRARWVLPMDGEPLHDGVLSISNNRIVAVEKFSSHGHNSSVVDLGDVAIIPGLVNAHIHLEFSHLEKPLGTPGIEFSEWIRAIVRNRAGTASGGNSKHESIKRGVEESLAAGVWVLGEIATTPFSFDDYLLDTPDDSGSIPPHECSTQRVKLRPHVVAFHEQLGRLPPEFLAKQKQVEKFLEQKTSDYLTQGISPHAPYSVHPQLFDLLCQSAIQYRVPVVMHLAESLAERELLEKGSGAFSELLRDFGIWENADQRETQSILEILEQLSQTPRSLVIHGNYLIPAEIEFIGKNRQKMSVVYCPRTHRYFNHDPYPLESLQRANITVAIGTDSRASNPDLNLFSDLKMVAETFPHLSPIDVLKLGTINGAIALGIDDQFGSIAVGKQAALSVVELDSSSRRETNWDLDWLWSEGARCRPLQTMP